MKILSIKFLSTTSSPTCSTARTTARTTCRSTWWPTSRADGAAAIRPAGNWRSGGLMLKDWFYTATFLSGRWLQAIIRLVMGNVKTGWPGREPMSILTSSPLITGVSCCRSISELVIMNSRGSWLWLVNPPVVNKCSALIGWNSWKTGFLVTL